MTQGFKTVIYPVSDLDAAKAVFTRLLGAQPTVDAPYYVGFDVAGQHIGLDPNGQGPGATPFWHVTDIQDRLDALVDAGAVVRQGVKDVGGGRLIATVVDTDGNPMGLLQDP
jgi:predicted enzyme related to lactoylglutathione lyase